MSSMKEQQVIARLKAMCDETSLRQAAKQLKISAPYLSDILLGRRSPGPKVLKRLGLSRRVERIIIYSSADER